MKRMISGFAVSALLLGAAPAFAQAAAQQKEEVVCKLLDNCADGSPAAAPAADPRGAPRTSKTRGFSLARPSDAPPAAAAAPAPSAPNRPKATAAAAHPMRAKPSVPGYDLNVTFRSGSADLTTAFKSRAAIFANALQDQRLAGRRVRIEGHTDSVGNAASNQDLSQRRARAVADLLIAAGVDANRLDVAGFGSAQPLPGLPSTASAQRRVVAVLVK